MSSYIQFALMNAAMIVPLAGITAAARLFKRPALTHLLWVVVLVKLLMPPFVLVPIMDRDWMVSTSHHFVPPILSQLERIDLMSRTSNVSVDSKATPQPKNRLRTLADRDKQPAPSKPSFLINAVFWIRSSAFQQLVWITAELTWGFGALVWFLIQGYRCIRFRFSLSEGTAAPQELQDFANKLAHRLGLKHSPKVWLMPGILSPMLWGNGQSTLLIFPEELLNRLSPEATGTLLIHELAHYRRNDHWVRIITLMATGFYWWHPVVWWARREIEAVEEECCDALVLRAASTPPKCYAEAILEAVDFLAESQLRLPPLATGLGQVPFLRQRLTWIMRGPRRQDIGICGRLLCIILMGTLPFQPTWLAAARSPEIRITQPIPKQSIEVAPETLVIPDTPSEAESATETVNPITAKAETPKRSSRWNGFDVRSTTTDGRFVVLANKSSNFLLDLESDRELDLSDFLVTALAFSRDSLWFTTIGEDHVLRLWDATNCEIVKAWQVPTGLKSVDISPNGHWIATGGRDGVARIWNTSSSEPIRELLRELAPVNCVRFSSDGKLFAISTGDWMTRDTGRIALFHVGSWTERISMNWNSPTAAVAFHTDGESLISGDWQGRIARWSIASGVLLGLAHGHKDLMAAAEFSPNGSLLAEIQIPDLPIEASWEEPKSDDSTNWFFRLRSSSSKMTAPSFPQNLTAPRNAGNAFR